MNGRKNTTIYVPEDDCEVQINSDRKVRSNNISEFRRRENREEVVLV